MKKDTITVLICEPGKPIREEVIKNNLDTFQELVDGYIEFINLGDNLSIICNDEAKLRGDTLPNRRLGRDIIFGTFFIVRYNRDGDCVSLRKKDIAQLVPRFYWPLCNTDDDPSLYDEVRDAYSGFTIVSWE